MIHKEHAEKIMKICGVDPKLYGEFLAVRDQIVVALEYFGEHLREFEDVGPSEEWSEGNAQGWERGVRDAVAGRATVIEKPDGTTEAVKVKAKEASK